MLFQKCDSVFSCVCAWRPVNADDVHVPDNEMDFFIRASDDVESSNRSVNLSFHRDSVDIAGPVQGHEVSRFSTAEAPHGNIVVELDELGDCRAERALQQVANIDTGV